VTTIAFHKPYGVLSRFTPDGSAWQTLAGFGLPPAVKRLTEALNTNKIENREVKGKKVQKKNKTAEKK
jgi:hypothetical protein